MKKGFTILELLVASLLLGMLVTILTMVFNQSSIAWRTGMAGVADLDKVRDNMAEIREEADNVFAHGSMTYRLTSLWKKNGALRKRACSAGTGGSTSGEQADTLVYLNSFNETTSGSDISTIDVGSGSSKRVKTYTVGVTSWGPDRKENTYDDITTWPDVIE